MTEPQGAQSGPANGQQVTMFTQDQVNHFAAQAKRGALESFFKDLGLDKVPSAEELAGALNAAGEYSKIKAGEKTEVQRLTEELATAKSEAEKVPGLQAQLARAGVAADAGLKSRFWKFIEGDDAESIKASVEETRQELGLAEPSADGAEGGTGGAGKPPQQSAGLTPNPQQGTGGGNGRPASSSLEAGASAYAAKHGKKELST